MEIETDELRLEQLEILGGKCLRARGQPFTAIFDNDYLTVTSADVDVQSSVPVLTCRTSDVQRIGMVRGDEIEGLDRPYLVERHEPDGTGMSRVILAEP